MITELADKVIPPLSLFAPYPPIGDRSSWKAVPEDFLRQLTAAGEAFLHYDYPVLKASDFMEFCRTGNRVNYENKLFARRTALNALVLAECAEAKGRFLDDIINGIFCICEESAWQLPAHNSYIRDTPQLLLPDVTRPVIDLFAAETGAILAVTDYLLKDVLNQISPAVSAMIEDNLERRIFKPYLTEHFWWMGDGKSHMNNWTSWCTQNVLLAAFTRPLDQERQMAILKKACRSLDYFLDEYGPDGCCDEGAQYYRHAGLTLFNALEVLNGVTGGAFKSAYREEKVRNIAAYILNAHISDCYYVNFADCSPMAGRCDAREFLFGKRTDNPALTAFAASDYQKSEDPLTLQEHNLFYRLQTAFTRKEMLGYDKDAVIFHPDLYYESVGLFIARDTRFYLAVKAGDNGDSHNHNDTGSFIVYKDGKPMFIDLGVEGYTKKTFSPQRYEIWTMQSQYHNLPTLGGVMQKDGEEYGASQVECSLGHEVCRISMELSGAYPDERVTSYRREAVLEKGKKIVISDEYSGELRPAALSLMTWEKPVWDGKRLMVGELGSCEIAGGTGITIEEIPVTDPRLAKAWKHKVYRTQITFSGTKLTLTVT